MALTAKKVYAILKRQISDMEAKLNSPVRYRGTVATADLLPLNPDIGDMYNIESKSVYGEAGMNVAWNGVVWDTMGAPIDMSLYLTKEEAETVIQRLVTEYFEKNPVKPGATTEQAQQIEQNKTDIASLKTETGSLKGDIKTTQFFYGTDVCKNNIKFDSFERGGINGSGNDITNTTEIRTKGYVSVYSTMQVYINDKTRNFYIFEYASDYTFIKQLAYRTSNQIVTFHENFNYRIVVNNNDNTAVPLNTIITWNNVTFIRDFKQNLYESLLGQNNMKLILPAFEKGGLYGNGDEAPENNTDIRSKVPIYVPAGNYAITNPRKRSVFILLYKADLTYIGNVAWNDNSEYIPFIVSKNSYMRVVEKDLAGIEPSETSIGLYIDNALNTNIGYYKNGIIIASKGGENLGVPPSSLLSIKEAFKNGYDAYRPNVCKTSDGYYVLSHNRNINEVARNSDGTVIQETINIDQHTLDELNQYDYGIKYGTQFAGMKITQFDDAMSLCAKLGLRLDIEWKYPTMTQTDAENLYTAIVTHGYTNKNWHWVAYDTNMINAFKAVCDYVNIEILVEPKNIDWNLINEASSEKHDVVVGYSNSQGSPSIADIVKLRKLNIVQNKGTATNLEQMIEQINNGVTEIEANFAMPKKALINFALKI